MINTIIHGDCLEIMLQVPTSSVPLILCDLPYEMTENDWDVGIPFKPLWSQYERIITEDGVIVLTASQPFTSLLICSNLPLFKYSMIWDKCLGTGHLNAKKMPLKRHEDICIFSKSTNGNYTYNPIMRKGKMRDKTTGHASKNYGAFERIKVENDIYYPTSIIEEYAQQEGKEHPTQKPIELFRYLIETYSNIGDTVLDNCMGSGTTAVAAASCGRNFIGIEKELKYVNVANQRLEYVQPVMNF